MFYEVLLVKLESANIFSHGLVVGMLHLRQAHDGGIVASRWVGVDGGVTAVVAYLERHLRTIFLENSDRLSVSLIDYHRGNVAAVDVLEGFFEDAVAQGRGEFKLKVRVGRINVDIPLRTIFTPLGRALLSRRCLVLSFDDVDTSVHFSIVQVFPLDAHNDAVVASARRRNTDKGEIVVLIASHLNRGLPVSIVDAAGAVVVTVAYVEDAHGYFR